MRLSNFLFEGRSIKIDENKVFDFIKKNQKWKKSPTIYRGLTNSAPFLLLDPSKHIRFSDSKIYNLLIDNLDSWKQYPKRSKSTVCCTDRNVATTYGNIYIVLFEDKAKLAISPKMDMWLSFEKFADSFLESLDQQFFFLFKEMDLHNFLIKYDRLLKNFDVIDHYKKTDIKQLYEFFKISKLSIRKNILDIYMKNPNMKFIDFCDKYFSPDYNNFKLKNIGDKIESNVEVWSEENAILIAEKVWHTIKYEILT